MFVACGRGGAMVRRGVAAVTGAESEHKRVLLLTMLEQLFLMHPPGSISMTNAAWNILNTASEGLRELLYEWGCAGPRLQTQRKLRQVSITPGATFPLKSFSIFQEATEWLSAAEQLSRPFARLEQPREQRLVFPACRGEACWSTPQAPSWDPGKLYPGNNESDLEIDQFSMRMKLRFKLF